MRYKFDEFQSISVVIDVMSSLIVLGFSLATVNTVPAVP